MYFFLSFTLRRPYSPNQDGNFFLFWVKLLISYDLATFKCVSWKITNFVLRHSCNEGAIYSLMSLSEKKNWGRRRSYRRLSFYNSVVWSLSFSFLNKKCIKMYIFQYYFFLWTLQKLKNNHSVSSHTILNSQSISEVRSRPRLTVIWGTVQS